MKKTTKGTIAAGAAVLLLLGGGGTLAYWNDSANIAGQSAIQAGQLKVAQATAPSWKIKHQSGTEVAVSNIATVRIVPGDQLIYTGTYNVTSLGQNLAFTVGLAAGSIAAPATPTAADTALVSRLTAATSFTVNGGTATSAGTLVTVPRPTGRYNAVITTPVVIIATITWPFDSPAGTSPSVDNPAQTGKVDLSNFALTVTQVTPNPLP